MSGLPDPTGQLAGRPVLVTGGSGFIGGRLVERLVEDCGARVRVLVRDVAAAARPARFPVEIARGDVSRAGDVAAAARGCEVVFHCAYGTTGPQGQRARVNIEGTRNVLAAAAAERARVVHLSTLMVYGLTGDGDLDETAPRRRFGNAYSDSKLEAERLALAATRAGRAPVAVLQPTGVYGPWGGVWTAQVLRTLKAGRMILVDGGTGLANMVYVDDLVSAMLLAAVRDEAVGEALLISGEEPVTWRELYERFARMLGGSRTVAMSAAEALAHYRGRRRRMGRLAPALLGMVKEDRAFRERLFGTREVALLRDLGSRLPEAVQVALKRGLSGGAGGRRRPPAPASAALPLEELPIHPLTPEMIRFHVPRTRVRIDKARRLLGYRPVFGFERGMDLTERWARWANLLD